MARKLPTLCLDFDGVVHRYDSPWVDARTIADDVTEGFFEWLDNAARFFNIVVYSSRCQDPLARVAMSKWLVKQRKKWQAAGGKSPTGIPAKVTFACRKPAAFITIDDRALLFDGDWSKLNPVALLGFKPWNKRGAARD